MALTNTPSLAGYSASQLLRIWVHVPSCVTHASPCTVPILRRPRRLGVRVRVCKAAASNADPRQPQDWFLKCLQGGRARPLAVCGVATLATARHNAPLLQLVCAEEEGFHSGAVGAHGLPQQARTVAPQQLGPPRRFDGMRVERVHPLRDGVDVLLREKQTSGAVSMHCQLVGCVLVATFRAGLPLSRRKHRYVLSRNPVLDVLAR
jgi:hypothetical protein